MAETTDPAIEAVAAAQDLTDPHDLTVLAQELRGRAQMRARIDRVGGVFATLPDLPDEDPL